ncbi:unnamed protein product [Victoria cruziana]
MERDWAIADPFPLSCSTPRDRAIAYPKGFFLFCLARTLAAGEEGDGGIVVESPTHFIDGSHFGLRTMIKQGMYWPHLSNLFAKEEEVA